MKNIKTLIVHPDDRSTDFLKAVYENIHNKTVITGGVSVEEVERQIKKHDRVIMLGHGTRWGLLAVGQFYHESKNAFEPFYVINQFTAKHLKNKKDNIYIWCYASDFVKTFELEGFSSGMFISEVAEADYCGLPNQSKKDIDIQCMYFCNLVGAAINLTTKKLYEFVSDEFEEAALHCKVAEYNHKRLTYYDKRKLLKESTSF